PRTRRRGRSDDRRGRKLVLLTAASLALGGCSDRGGDPGGEVEPDAQFDGDSDAGPVDPGADGSRELDAGPPLDAGGASTPDGLRAEPDTARGDLGYPPSGDFDGESGARESGDARACYDGTDGDEEDGTDCADPSCHVLRSCCVGSGDCCAGASDWLGGPIDLSDETTCEGSGDLVATECLADAGFDTFSLAASTPEPVAAAVYGSERADAPIADTAAVRAAAPDVDDADAGRRPPADPRLRRARSWVETARLAALRGIGARNAGRLMAAGIDNVDELADADPGSLTLRLRTITGDDGDEIVEARVRVWVRAARDAVAARREQSGS
ncbi:MAG: DUF4332 domain-containing protein, partial [Gemmatimonadota bacterium]